MGIDSLDRKLAYLLKPLLGKKATRSGLSLDEYREMSYVESLSYEVRLGNGAIVYFTKNSKNYFDQAFALIPDALASRVSAVRNELYKAFKEVLAGCWEKGEKEISGSELLDRISSKIEARSKEYYVYAPISGIMLDGIGRFEFDRYLISEADSDLFRLVESYPEIVCGVWQRIWNKVLISGRVYGTYEFAQQQFNLEAKLVSAVLVLTYAAIADSGAANLCVEPEMGTGKGVGSCFAISSEGKDLSVTTTMGLKSPILINPEGATNLLESDWFLGLVSFVGKIPRTDLDAVLRRAIFWYFDAQADPQPEMQLVKFWSCIECVFSFEKVSITSAIENGLLSLLTMGGYRFYPIEDSLHLRKRISDLYEARSKAVHDAHYGHVTQRDIADVSKWAAWVIIEVFQLAQRGGYSTRVEIKEQADRLSRFFKIS